jgi:hypothetical protein
MLHRHSTLQKPDAAFLEQAHTVNNQCHLNLPVWDIDPARLTTFDTLLANADSAYQANSDIATRNATTSALKKAAFGELKHFMGMFIDYLEVNERVPDTALEFMGLRPRHQHVHQPLPRPADQIVITVRKQHDEMTVYAARPEHDHPTAGVGPVHYHGFMLRYKFEGADKYQTLVSTRLHHTLFFEQADEGKRVFLSAAWVNPRLEPGPWSEEIPEIIG